MAPPPLPPPPPPPPHQYQHQYQQQYPHQQQSYLRPPAGIAPYAYASVQQQQLNGLYGASPPAHPQHQYYRQDYQNRHSYSTSTNGYAVPPPPPPPPPPSSRDLLSNRAAADELRRTLAAGQKRDQNEEAVPSVGKKDDGHEIEKVFSCSVCPNVAFPTHKALDSHIAAHVTCWKEGCDFSASKSVVGGHYASVHGKFAGRGLKTVVVAVPGCKVKKFRICVGDHPDDIKAWIAERKKKFPTRERARKRAGVEEKRKAEGGLPVHSNGDLFSSGNKRVASENGTLYSISEKKARLEGNENKVSAEVPNKGEGGLTSLIGGYGSSSSDDEGDEEKAIATGSTMPGNVTGDQNNVESRMCRSDPAKNSFFRTRPCRFFMRTGRCRNGDNCNYLHEEGAAEAAEQRSLEQSQRDKAKRDSRTELGRMGRNDVRNDYIGPGEHAPLLRKLLQTDIRRERSLTLQLLRYIADCNFLQEKQKAKD